MTRIRGQVEYVVVSKRCLLLLLSHHRRNSTVQRYMNCGYRKNTLSQEAVDNEPEIFSLSSFLPPFFTSREEERSRWSRKYDDIVMCDIALSNHCLTSHFMTKFVKWWMRSRRSLWIECYRQDPSSRRPESMRLRSPSAYF